MFDISEDDDTGAVGEDHDEADFEEVGWGVGPGSGDGSNEEAGGGAGESPAVDLTLRCCRV